MNYQALQSDVLKALRSGRKQPLINELLGFKVNQVYRWESGRTQMSWAQFVEFCEICDSPLESSLQKCFSFFGKPLDTANLVQHFVGSQKQTVFAKEIQTTRYTLSRWLRGLQTPNLDQMFRMMYVGSIDFFRFLEELTRNAKLPSIQEDLKKERDHLALYDQFPWLSILLSALDLATYSKNPTIGFLSEKTKLPALQIQEALQALYEQGLLHWNGRHWETRVQRLAMRGSMDMRQKLARYSFSRTLDGVDAAFGNPAVRFSWKQFSLNQQQYEKLLQKYTEFFNELGGLVDQGQKDADKVYLFSAAFVDFDLLPQQKS
jgi:transcriptional regulator with XRE-family HTH domain